MGMVENAGGPFPSLKSKGAETRHLGKALLHVFLDHYDQASQVHRVMRSLLEVSIDLETTITNHMKEIKFPVPVAIKFLQQCSDYTQQVTFLANHFHPKGERYFNFTFKFHQLLHCGFMARYLNPARTWCYQGEDMMQRVRALICSCTRSLPQQSWCVKGMDKYNHGYAFLVRAI